MRTIFADFNWINEDDHVVLTTIGSEADVRRAGLKPGDWAWLSDGEILAGAQIQQDSKYGLVGALAWETLVNLDEEEAQNWEILWGQLEPLLQGGADSTGDHLRRFQLLTQLERVAPDNILAARSGDLSLRRAQSLRVMGHPALAMLELQDAREARPDDPVVDTLYLETLRSLDLDRARSEADSLMSRSDVAATVMASCITILATAAERDERFEPIARRVLEWCERLLRSPEFKGLPASLRALSYFNRGMMLLRLGRAREARDDFRLAHKLDSIVPAFDEATRLDAYDQQARELADRVRDQQAPVAA